MYIKNKRDSSSIKVCSPFKHPCKQKNYASESLTFHILNVIGN